MSAWLAASFSAFGVSLLSALLLSGCASGNSGSTGNTTTPTVTLPAISTISPSVLPVGSGATTLTVIGTNFVSTSVVQVAGVSEATTFVSATQLQVSVPPNLLGTGRLLPVVVLNGDSTSLATPVNLEVDNPLPAISSFTPASFGTGSMSSPVSVVGSGFVPTSTVQINGSARPTSYISGTQLSVTLIAGDLAASGSLTMNVVNPGPGGGTSSASSIAVNNPVPSGLVLTPNTAVIGAGPVSIVVRGANFNSTTAINVNGSSRPTSFVSSTEVIFTLSPFDQLTATTLVITATNPAPGGGISPAVSLIVGPPGSTPVITLVTPSQFLVGSASTTILVTGSDFTTSSVIQWNAANLATSAALSGSTVLYLVGTVPASLLASAGTANVTVFTPTGTPTTSNPTPVSVTLSPTPSITSVTPASAPLGRATLITVFGTDFTPTSTIFINGTSLATTYKDAAHLIATIPATAFSLPGNNSITVNTPAPGGGTSPAVPFLAYIGIANNIMVYNPFNGLLYVSVPSSAGPPYGNSVVSVDPATGTLGTPIFVGSEPNQLALTADGRYLWVGLDGASAVRKVDLVTLTAGLQFALGQGSGLSSVAAPSVQAMVALPGSDDSVVIQLNNVNQGSFAIYDSGVPRGSPVSESGGAFYALQADGGRSEIYAAGLGYSVYSYSASGLALESTLSETDYAGYDAAEIQIAGGHVFTDRGIVGDAESGASLGTFYLTGTTPAAGPTTADIALGKAFVLDTTPGNSVGGFNQIQVFNLSNYTQSAVIPAIVLPNLNFPYVAADHLTRWGKNGLAFRTSSGVYSLRSNLVQDLSTTSADLSVALSSTGSITGANTTYTVTVTNSGPSDASGLALNAQLPSASILVSASTPSGACAALSSVTCNLGSLASGSSAVVTIVVTQMTAGIALLTAQVAASENDPNPANNQTTSTITITGNTYSPAPTITSISPNSIPSGSTDTLLTVTGSGFTTSSTIQAGGAPLPTNFVSATTLTATVPAVSLTMLGWTPVTVSTPAPGGGTTSSVPLSIFSVITLGLNHIIYDPYSRKIMASVGSGSSTITGNSIVTITPETATVGTPVNIGSKPTNLSLTSDGQILYTILTGSQSVARFNMLTGQPDFTYPVPANSSFDGPIVLRGVAAQPGTEDTVALDLGQYPGDAIYDFNPTSKTAAIRGQASQFSASCIQFLDAGDLLAFDVDDSTMGFEHYPVTSAGITPFSSTSNFNSALNHFGCFKLSGGLAFANEGGIANPATTPASEVGVFQGVIYANEVVSQQALAPDASLQRAFYPSNAVGTTRSPVDGINAYDPNTFFLGGNASLNIAAVEGTTTYFPVDLIRWGQDGLALLTSGGHLFLLRGGFVVPQLLNTNTAPTLTSASATSITHGAGNTLLTLTGANFVPGVAALWNGTYRTTTIIDATHVTMAIAASDLVAAGSVTIALVNPGGPPSALLTFTVQ